MKIAQANPTGVVSSSPTRIMSVVILVRSLMSACSNFSAKLRLIQQTPSVAIIANIWMRKYVLRGGRPMVEVTEVVRLIEEALGKPAVRELLPMQPGDVPQTCADAADLERAVGFRPNTPITEGVRRFVDWLLRFRQN